MFMCRMNASIPFQSAVELSLKGKSDNFSDALCINVVSGLGIIHAPSFVMTLQSWVTQQ